MNNVDLVIAVTLIGALSLLGEFMTRDTEIEPLPTQDVVVDRAARIYVNEHGARIGTTIYPAWEMYRFTLGDSGKTISEYRVCINGRVYSYFTGGANINAIDANCGAA